MDEETHEGIGTIKKKGAVPSIEGTGTINRKGSQGVDLHHLTPSILIVLSAAGASELVR